MNVLVTGDCHSSVRKFSDDNVKESNGGVLPTHIFVAGDFGVIWDVDPENYEEKDKLDYLEKKPYEVLVVSGNHENYERLYSLPVEEHLGAPAYKLRENVWVLQHGNIYTIEDKKFFIFGGALSIDKEWRVNRVSWWEEEIPTHTDLARAIKNLKEVDGKVDYVITHTAPREVLDQLVNVELLLPVGENPKFDDPTVKMQTTLKDLIDWSYLKEWFFGHFHYDVPVICASGHEYTLTYNNFYAIK